jgi:hypothetical protein
MWKTLIEREVAFHRNSKQGRKERPTEPVFWLHQLTDDRFPCSRAPLYILACLIDRRILLSRWNQGSLNINRTGNPPRTPVYWNRKNALPSIDVLGESGRCRRAGLSERRGFWAASSGGSFP